MNSLLITTDHILLGLLLSQLDFVYSVVNFTLSATTVPTIIIIACTQQSSLHKCILLRKSVETTVKPTSVESHHSQELIYADSSNKYKIAEVKWRWMWNPTLFEKVKILINLTVQTWRFTHSWRFLISIPTDQHGIVIFDEGRVRGNHFLGWIWAESPGKWSGSEQTKSCIARVAMVTTTLRPQ